MSLLDSIVIKQLKIVWTCQENGRRKMTWYLIRGKKRTSRTTSTCADEMMRETALMEEDWRDKENWRQRITRQI